MIKFVAIIFCLCFTGTFCVSQTLDNNDVTVVSQVDIPEIYSNYAAVLESYVTSKNTVDYAKQIKEFLSRDIAFEFDSATKTLYLNEIFFIHSQDFIDNYGEIKSFRAFEPKLQSAFNFINQYGNWSCEAN